MLISPTATAVTRFLTPENPFAGAWLDHVRELVIGDPDESADDKWDRERRLRKFYPEIEIIERREPRPAVIIAQPVAIVVRRFMPRSRAANSRNSDGEEVARAR